MLLPIIEKQGTTQDIETVVLGDHTLKVWIFFMFEFLNSVCVFIRKGGR